MMPCPVFLLRPPARNYEVATLSLWRVQDALLRFHQEDLDGYRDHLDLFFNSPNFILKEIGDQMLRALNEEFFRKEGLRP